MNKNKQKITLALLSFILFLASYQNTFARGGGGGSGGGGGGGGGSSSSSSGGSGEFTWVDAVIMIAVLTVFVLVIYVQWRRKKQAIARAEAVIDSAAHQDAVWEKNDITKAVEDTFFRFQKDWSDLNPERMREYLTESYYKRMVLEMNVLQNEKRRNIVGDPVIKRIDILEAVDEIDNSKDTFTAEISAQATDMLLDDGQDDTLYIDDRPFTEQWVFKRDGDVWKLDVIKQATADITKKENDIEEFALRNGFYYDLDFGWLMMPNKGVLFKKTNFKVSDINNHVIGYFRDKIVEFYTYIPKENSFNYVVAQAIIPKTYSNILIRKKRAWFNFSPRGLKRVRTESIEFDNKFCVWADSSDQVNSLELLAPDFMEKIYNLPFELNIELVGNVLYLYARERKDINYDTMLEILSWAFDEMER